MAFQSIIKETNVLIVVDNLTNNSKNALIFQQILIAYKVFSDCNVTTVTNSDHKRCEIWNGMGIEADYTLGELRSLPYADLIIIVSDYNQKNNKLLIKYLNSLHVNSIQLNPAEDSYVVSNEMAPYLTFKLDSKKKIVKLHRVGNEYKFNLSRKGYSEIDTYYKVLEIFKKEYSAWSFDDRMFNDTTNLENPNWLESEIENGETYYKEEESKFLSNLVQNYRKTNVFQKMGFTINEFLEEKMVVLALYEGMNEIGLASLIKLWSNMKNSNIVPVIFSKSKIFEQQKSSRNKERIRFNSQGSNRSTRSTSSRTSSQDREFRTIKRSDKVFIKTKSNARIFARTFQSFAAVDLIVRNVEAYIIPPGNPSSSEHKFITGKINTKAKKSDKYVMTIDQTFTQYSTKFKEQEIDGKCLDTYENSFRSQQLESIKMLFSEQFAGRLASRVYI